eukprot:1160757-Pelagomonas_calceolata.AAC.2
MVNGSQVGSHLGKGVKEVEDEDLRIRRHTFAEDSMMKRALAQKSRLSHKAEEQRGLVGISRECY